MNAAAILIILVSHQGYWFGGDTNQINVEWVVKAAMPAADLRWELFVGEIKVASGQTPMPADLGKTVVRIVPPEVRVRLAMRWKYTLIAHDGGKELENGERIIDVFPDSMLHGLAHRIGENRVAIWEQGADIGGIFDRAKAPYAHAKDPTRIGFDRPDVILVGADTIDPSPFGQGPLLDLARAGASVMIFRQRRVDALGAYDVVRRDPPAKLEWVTDHPLLRGFDEKMLDAIGNSGEIDLAVRLPADEPALAIAAWPREIPGVNPVGTDALLVSKAIGKGRIVLSQLPLTDYQHDPRAQMLLINAVDYLLSSPEPTPRPSERTAMQVTEHTPPSTVTIPLGDQP